MILLKTETRFYMPFGKIPLPVVWGEIVTEHKSECPTHSEAKQYQNIRVLEHRKVYCRAMQRDGWLMP